MSTIDPPSQHPGVVDQYLDVPRQRFSAISGVSHVQLLDLQADAALSSLPLQGLDLSADLYRGDHIETLLSEAHCTSCPNPVPAPVMKTFFTAVSSVGSRQSMAQQNPYDGNLSLPRRDRDRIVAKRLTRPLSQLA